MAIPFLTGQRLTADLLNANLIDYFPTTISKSSVTSRTSTTTMTDDPELQGIPLSIGIWEIELVGQFTTTASNVPGIRTQWGFTGTWVSGTIRSCTGPGVGSTVQPGIATVLNTRGWTLSNGTAADQAQYQTYLGTAFAGFREICRTVSVSVAGNLSLQWAQQTSNANATDLRPTTHFNIRKIS